MDIYVSWLQVTKIAVSILIVIALAEIAKRVNPVIAGILAGLPLGAGLAVYFIGYEQGVHFLIPGLPWAVAGLIAALLFCLAYLIIGLTTRRKGLAAVVLCSVGGLAAFVLSGTLIQRMELGLISAAAAFGISTILVIQIMKRIPIPSPVTEAQAMGLKGFIIRGLITGGIIILVTAAAPFAGSQWSGVLSAFPSTLYSLLVLIHYDYGNELYPSILKSFAYSVTTLAVFYIACFYTIPLYGLNVGFGLAYIISAGYLYLVNSRIPRANMKKHTQQPNR